MIPQNLLLLQRGRRKWKKPTIGLEELGASSTLPRAMVARSMPPLLLQFPTVKGDSLPKYAKFTLIQPFFEYVNFLFPDFLG